MNGALHVDLTRRVALAVLGDAKTADEIAGYADFPDRVDDIVVEGVGTSIVGRRLCSLAHFPVPLWPSDAPAQAAFGNWRKVAFRGYGWKLDNSVPWIDLPDRDVRCNVRAWEPAIGAKQAKHRPPPLVMLLRAANNRGLTAAADEIVYPDAVEMARWLGNLNGPRALGCALHFVQDACVYHHARGVLLGGHSTYEAGLDEAWFGGGLRTPRDRWVRLAHDGKRKMPPDQAATKCAMFAFLNMTTTGTIINAISRTAAVLRWWRDKA